MSIIMLFKKKKIYRKSGDGMSYCVNCGVELEKSEKACPLCGIEVKNPV